MNLLIIREQDNKGIPAEIVDVKIIPADKKEIEKYAKRAADLNRSQKRRNYTIEEYPDNSLIAFLATDRQYDTEKYTVLAREIRKDISALAERLDLLGIYFQETVVV